MCSSLRVFTLMLVLLSSLVSVVDAATAASQLTATPPKLSASLDGPSKIDPGARFQYSVQASSVPVGENVSSLAIFDIDLPSTVTIMELPAFCSADKPRMHVRCATAVTATPFLIAVRAPDLRSGVTLAATMSAKFETQLEPVTNQAVAKVFRYFETTNSDDDGEGSLRRTILAANQSCIDDFPCKIAFRIATPSLTIHPKTPLPAIEGVSVDVDGDSQKTHVADTNPGRPEIELRGDLQQSGDGLTLRTRCDSIVSGFVIGGFPRYGIALDDTSPCAERDTFPSESINRAHVVRGNYVGTDRTGSVAVPNFRGIATIGTNVVPYLLDRNVVSGNVRSGVFFASGAHHLVNDSTIGLDAARTKALGNGASGIYIAAFGSDVFKSMIAFNHDAGVSIDATSVEVGFNSIFANGSLGIDVGLDGPTRPSASVIGVVLSYAYYVESENKTFVVGRLVGPIDPASARTRFFANDAPDPSGEAQGQYSLGQRTYDPWGVPDEANFVYTGNLRGKWITATVTAVHRAGAAPSPAIGTDGSFDDHETTTSEFSRPVLVQ
jgi:hypothetical protein